MTGAPARTTIVLAAGGTGGHMFPARALARELLARGYAPVLVTDRRGGGFGPELADQVPTHHIPAAGYAGGDVLSKANSLLRLATGYWAARRILRKVKPHAVVGFGGYAALSTCIAAAHKRVRLVLHEQNAVVGRANRVLAPRADAIATSFPSVQGLKPADQGKVRMTGNPVRSSFVAVGRKPYAVADAAGPLRLLVTGGSQGARVFNDLIPDAVALLPTDIRRRLVISQQVRGTDFESVRARYAGTGAETELRSFFDDLPERLQQVHLVIARAGASTVTELAAAGRPAILVPYPFAADDHQAANARAFAEAGAGWAMPQAALTAESLATKMRELFNDPVALTGAASAAHRFAAPKSAANLAALVLDEADPLDNGQGRGTGAAPDAEAAA
jgi:UDP-N-acetylglucosamine--N-acetylmuramyl-(pentapeptide) pyrophosphoryl-undecaprenol N-acetylglucosamine transferase